MINLIAVEVDVGTIVATSTVCLAGLTALIQQAWKYFRSAKTAVRDENDESWKHILDREREDQTKRDEKFSKQIEVIENRMDILAAEHQKCEADRIRANAQIEVLQERLTRALGGNGGKP